MAVQTDKPTQHRSKVGELTKDAGLFLLLLIAGWAYTFQIEVFLDIGLYDETHYLRNGLDLPKVGLPPADGWPRGAPLYAVWYWLLSLIFPDPVELYYANYKATVVLPALACFFFLRTSHVARTVSVVLSIYVLFFNGNLAVWPRVSHLALTILLCGLALAAWMRSRVSKGSVCLLTALCVSYVRPEFFLTFLCMCCLVVWLFLRSPPGIRRSLSVPVLVSVTGSALLLLFLGIPFASMDRSWLAFNQHYALNAANAAASEINAWTNTDRFVKADFPHATSVGEAVRENPGAFGKHVMKNLSVAPGSIRSLFLLPFRRTYPTNRHQIAWSILAVLVVLAVTYVLTRGARRVWKRLWRLTRASTFPAVILLFFLLPPILSSVIFYPRDHYLLFLLLLPIQCAAVFCRTGCAGQGDTLHAVAVCVLAVFIGPSPAAMGPKPRPNLAVIDVLRAHPLDHPVNILEAEGEYGVYVGDNYHRVPEYAKRSGFNTFVWEESIDMIVVSELLKKDPRFSEDPEWLHFLANPSSLGFFSVEVPGTPGRVILVGDDLR